MTLFKIPSQLVHFQAYLLVKLIHRAESVEWNHLRKRDSVVKQECHSELTEDETWMNHRENISTRFGQRRLRIGQA